MRPAGRSASSLGLPDVHARGNFLCKRMNRVVFVLGLRGQLLQLAMSLFQAVHVVLPQIRAVRKALKNIVFTIQWTYLMPQLAIAADLSQECGPVYIPRIRALPPFHVRHWGT